MRAPEWLYMLTWHPRIMASGNDVLWLNRYSAGWLDGAPGPGAGTQDLGFKPSVSAAPGSPKSKTG
jgi:hypothetical protein